MLLKDLKESNYVLSAALSTSLTDYNQIYAQAIVYVNNKLSKLHIIIFFHEYGSLTFCSCARHRFLVGFVLLDL